jgi:hypothetical protein
MFTAAGKNNFAYTTTHPLIVLILMANRFNI